MSNAPAKSNAATERAFKIVELLAGRFYDGMSNKELSDALKTPASSISRDMKTLVRMDCARRLSSGRWSLSVWPLQVIQNYIYGMQSMQASMTETNQLIFTRENGNAQGD